MYLKKKKISVLEISKKKYKYKSVEIRVLSREVYEFNFYGEPQ